MQARFRISGPDDASLEEILAVYRILHRAGLQIPNQWLKAHKKHDFTPEKAETHAKLMVASLISNRSQSPSRDDMAKVFAALERKSPERTLILSEIAGKFDNTLYSDYSQGNVYEKAFHLTFSKDYVMQSGVVWDRSIKAGNVNAIGETILLSIVLLRNQDLQNVNPPLLRDVLQNVENVGLTDISRKLALEATFGNI